MYALGFKKSKNTLNQVYAKSLLVINATKRLKDKSQEKRQKSWQIPLICHL
jgi:hypothetical protein